MTSTDAYPQNRIEEMRNDHKELAEYLLHNGQLRLKTVTEDAFSKTLLIAVASYFEVRVSEIIIDLYRELSQGTDILAEFVRNKAIERRFSNLFQWERKNANFFYSSFGKGFSDYMQKKVAENQTLDKSVQAFLEIGNLRNQIAHRNYADFQLNKTAEEVYSLYKDAAKFVDEFPIAIREFIRQQNINNAP